MSANIVNTLIYLKIFVFLTIQNVMKTKSVYVKNVRITRMASGVQVTQVRRVNKMKKILISQPMTDDKFIRLCKDEVRKYAEEHLDKSDSKVDFDVYIVWYCKTLQNWKALASTTLYDGMYYELTLSGDKQELYLDAYKKFENKCISLESEEH